MKSTTLGLVFSVAPWIAHVHGLPVAAQPGHAGGPVLVAPSPQPPPGREALDARVQEAVAEGFSGAVLVVRDGEVVLSKGYGDADREKGVANTPETIFGIGSTPIDFTKAAILLLSQEGKLTLSDPITSFFKDVPEDKRGMTLEQLMTGRSGLANFHELPGDANPDHAWIDRAEAVRRILAGKLLFEPGMGNEHSHSAFGLLAAVIEIASGQSYQQFLQSRLFAPLGMRDTGFFGSPVPPERMAIGYGKQSGTGINAPPFWGKTSWLVMGSGGMTSTLGDLRTFITAIREGKIVDRELSSSYLFRPGEMLAGGDVHGYEIVISLGRSKNSVMLVVNNCYNGKGPNPMFKNLADDLAQMAEPQDAPPPYMIGVRFAIEQEGGVSVEGVVPDGPGEAAGLQAGDVVLALNGVPIGDDPLSVLRTWMMEGKKVEFEVVRGGKKMKLVVTPRKR